MVWHHGYVLPWSLSATFCSSVKGMVPRNKTIRFDFIWALQNFCSFWYFSSILLSIYLHTSEWVAFVLHQALGITGNSLRVNYTFGIYIVTFCTYTTFCTTISTAYLYTVWKKTTSCFLLILPSHLQLHIPYFRTKIQLRNHHKPVRNLFSCYLARH